MITNCNDDVLVVKFPGTVVAVSSTSTETYRELGIDISKR
jgi:hypothetical protein